MTRTRRAVSGPCRRSSSPSPALRTWMWSTAILMQAHTLIGYVDDLIYSAQLRYFDELLPGLAPQERVAQPEDAVGRHRGAESHEQVQRHPGERRHHHQRDE